MREKETAIGYLGIAVELTCKHEAMRLVLSDSVSGGTVNCWHNGSEIIFYRSSGIVIQ